MATDFYKQNGSYFTTAGQKILNLTELQGFAKAGGEETPAPIIQPPTGMTQITAGQARNFDIKGQIGATGTVGSYLYGIPKNTINPTLLEPVQSADFTTPEPTPTDNPANINSDITKTEPLQPQEADLQSKINDIMGLNLDIAGKDAYRTSQEALQPDLEAQKKAEVDLSAQLKTLQADALNIPLQTTTQYASHNLSTQQVGLNQADQLRTNAIKANTVGALLAATQGKIAYAQGLVDKAVNAEFAPKEAKQKALLANLDLILKSPLYTNEEKKRAAAQKLIEDQKTADLAQAKTDKASILATATEAVKNGLTDTLLIKQISEAKTPIEALQLAQGFLDINKKVQGDKIDTINKMTLDGYQYLTNLNGITSESQITRIKGADGVDMIFKNPPAKAKSSGGGGGGGGGVEVTLTPEEKALKSKIDAELVKLARGGSWGDSWNFIKNLYPDIPNEVLDEALNKSQYYPTGGTPTEDTTQSGWSKLVDWVQFWK